ncbi:MAG: hypothetical protein JSV92_04040 [archaeon]|nr:MAG: hypothetical protein JSV92_04040 [archaeon]
MVTVKSFSIRRERNEIRLNLTCASSKFKEKIIHVDIPLPQVRSLVRDLEKAMESETGEELSGEDQSARYIG